MSRPPTVPSGLTDTRGDYIAVSCGTAEGNFYFNRLKDVGSRAGGVKCIWYNDSWITPNDFEISGGKGKNKSWKKSLFHNQLSVQSCLNKLGITTSRTLTPTPSSQLSSASGEVPTSPNPNFIINPVLAFIKAFRLKSDRDSLHKLALSHFDISRLSGAYKTLWDHCSTDLEELGLSFHQRRSCESVMNDLCSAIDKLDIVNKLPPFFCEACDLITIPSVEVDPVSQRIEQNTVSIDRLTDSFKELPNLISDAITKSISSTVSMKSLEESAQKLNDQISRLSLTLSQTSTSDTHQPIIRAHKSQKSENSNSLSSKKPAKPEQKLDRSLNIICFGLPEVSSLSELNESVHGLLKFLVGNSITFKDAIRLGRRSPGTQLKDSRPRPLLIKLVSVWDKRLVLSSVRKLRDYSVPRLFVREDLSPEAREDRRDRSVKPKPVHVAQDLDDSDPELTSDSVDVLSGNNSSDD